MEPWNMNNWPEWKHQFQLHLATFEYLGEAEKINLFLESLGSDGVFEALKLYADLEYPANKSVTFAQLWWQFNQHCWAKYIPKKDPTKDLLEDRVNLRQMCDEAKFPPILKLIPILSLCELEFVSQRIPKLERVVRNFAVLFGVRIEPCCLRNHQIGINESIYIINGLIVSSLTLKSLPESDAVKILPFFQKLKHFGMENMNIFEDTREFPKHLTELTLIDCKIEVDPMFRWFYAFNTTLRRLHLENVERFFHYGNDKGVLPYIDLRYMLANLQSLTVISQFWNIEIDAHNLEFLIIKSDGYDFLRAPNLKYFHCDVAKKNCFPYYDDPMTDLNFLTLRNWKTIKPGIFPSLVEVEILSPVDPKFKEEIDSLTINVLVNYCAIPKPLQEEPNSVFEMLNHDCLLEIIQHLDSKDWMTFGRLHPNAEMVVATYKYPRVRTSSRDYLITGMYAEDQEHFMRVSKLVENLWFCQNAKEYDIDWSHFIGAFENASTLTVISLSTDLFDSLPTGLHKLEVAHSSLIHPSSAAYLRRLNPTLKILGISTSFSQVTLNDDQLQCLAELQNLQEFYSEVSLPQSILTNLLDINRNSLQCITLTFLTNELDGWTPHENILKSLSTMTNLKELGIRKRGDQSNNDYGLDVHLLTEMLRAVGPILKTLTLTGWFTDNEMRRILSCDFLKNLQKLTVELFRDEELGSMFSRLTGLRTLKIVSDCYVREPQLIDDKFGDFFAFIKSLPKLEELYVPYARSTFKFEIELTELLKRTNRILRIKSA